MIQWWQHIPERIDPSVFSVGFFSLRWYAVFFLIGFVVIYFLGQWMIRTKRTTALLSEEWEDISVWLLVGALIGARIGYVFLYDSPYFAAAPWRIVMPYDFGRHIWTGILGMSFHTGLIGVVVVIGLFVRKRKLHFWRVADMLSVVAPIGLLFGRLGNFWNEELYGRVTTVPWGMVFPGSRPLGALRHPSQLYEAFFEGFILFIVLYLLKAKKKSLPDGIVSAVFLSGYGSIRFAIEFFREPDPQIGFIFGWMTFGQLLSLGMVVVGWFLFWQFRQSGKYAILKKERTNARV